MKYTTGELRKMNGRKCKLKFAYLPKEEGEIYVVDGEVSFVSNISQYAGRRKRKDLYKYSRLLYSGTDSESDISGSYSSITFLDEPHQNIYYDDNGEEIREGDWVLVCGGKLKRIFLCKIPRRERPYICVDSHFTELYHISTELIVSTSEWGRCIKYKDEKKPRELMLTNEEYEEVKNKYK